jgi:membrane protein implicated in regulation of membrane protease activity
MAIFVTAALAGAVFVIIILLLGGDHDVAVDHDFDSGTDLSGGGPSVVSIKLIALAVCGWGVAGAIARYNGASMWGSSIYGLIGAALLGIVGYLFIMLFYRSQASSTIMDEDYAGVTGRVVTTVRADGLGEISSTIRGRTCSLMARSEDGSTIEADSLVRIVRKVGNVVIVKKV